MSKTALKVISGDPENVAARDWDKRLSAAIGHHYVEVGNLLIEGRDGQHYRTLGDFKTLEDYTSFRFGIGGVMARYMVRAAIVYEAMEEKLGVTNSVAQLPATECQMRALIPCVRFNTEQRMIETFEGKATPATLPIGVANIDEVATVWKSTVEKFDKKYKAWEIKKAHAEKKGERVPPRPKMSATFIHNMLPNKYKTSKKLPFTGNRLVLLVGRLERLRDDMEGLGCFNKTKLSAQVIKEPAMYDYQLAELKAEVTKASEALAMFRELLEGYE